MPRFVINSSAKPGSHDSLVRRLAQELRSPGESPQPLILEETIGATGSRHVHVIWDRWKTLSDDERSQVIVEAYSRADGPEVAEQITIAAGVTPKEALALGLLPWKVVRAQKKSARPTPPMLNDVVDASRAEQVERQSTVLGRSVRELRYAREEDAEQARQRLEQAVPGSRWKLVKEEQIEA